jgi:hypothetical protein
MWIPEYMVWGTSSPGYLLSVHTLWGGAQHHTHHHTGYGMAHSITPGAWYPIWGRGQRILHPLHHLHTTPRDVDT